MRFLKMMSLLVLASSALIPHPPNLRTPAAVVMVAACGSLLAGWWVLVFHRLGRLPKSTAGACLVGFLLLVLQSSLIASWHGTPLSQWFYGAIPFLFLTLYFPFLEVSRYDPRFLLNAVLTAALVWLAKVILIASPGVSPVLSGDVERLTYVADMWRFLLLPFGMVGLTLALFAPTRFIRRIRWVVAPLFTIVALLSMYRGQAIVVGGIWLAYALWSRARRGERLAVATSLVVAAVWLLLGTRVGTSLRTRFQSLPAEIEGSRVSEIGYALEAFRESPVFGKGLGYPVPVEVSFAGDPQAMLMSGAESVGYVHNFVAYLLMDLGLGGFLAFAAFLFAGMRRRRDDPRRDPDQLRTTGSLAVLALIFWMLVQASIRMIHTHLLLSALGAVLASRQRRESAGPEVIGSALRRRGAGGTRCAHAGGQAPAPD